MATEIERKFLVCSETWRGQVEDSKRYRQGYLANTESSSIRVRMSDSRAWLNIKRATAGVRRSEFDYPIPVADARELLAMCEGRVIEKTRYHVRCAGHLWEVDVFEGDNLGLTVAEIELDSVAHHFERPPWLGEEITHDRRYYNNMLSMRPYNDWA